MATKYGIARRIYGVSINPYEFVLNNKNEVIKFNSVDECIEFLYEHTAKELTQSGWADDGIYFVKL